MGESLILQSVFGNCSSGQLKTVLELKTKKTNKNI